MQVIHQLFLRQAVCQARKNIAVDKGRVLLQHLCQRGLRPLLDFCGDHTVLIRNGFRFGI